MTFPVSDDGQAVDQLQILLDALNRNAVDFRRRGIACCAVQAENIAVRLAEAMKETPSE